jgi:glyoxylase-like metal-dependent hydrolase (beta-lactamase superfamily II)/rhodanese-related sulfurtransferase
MLFRQLFDSETATYTYILGDPDSKEAVIIDPVRDQIERDEGLLNELGLQLKYSLETHIHADHITGSGVLRQRLGCKTVTSAAAGAACSDMPVRQGDKLKFGAYELEVRQTPGHTEGCLTYVLHSEGMAFTGDALLVRGTGRTDFQQGDAHKLFRSIHTQIFSLPDATLIYPAHDYKGRMASTVGEEKKFNPRINLGKSEAEFVSIMSHLALAKPNKIDEAVPANLHCGIPDAGTVSGEPIPERAWARVERTPDGVPEVSPAWVRSHTNEVHLVDVRSAEEFNGELGHIEGADLVPLEVLGHAATAWSPNDPLVTVCRSGKRSAAAALTLERAGFVRVASMRGGMLTWNAERFPVARHADANPDSQAGSQGPHA